MVNEIIPVPSLPKKDKIRLKRIPFLEPKRFREFEGDTMTLLNSPLVDEHALLEKEPRKYTYDEVLECMRNACTLTAAYGIPKDADLEALIPRHGEYDAS